MLAFNSQSDARTFLTNISNSLWCSAVPRRDPCADSGLPTELESATCTMPISSWPHYVAMISPVSNRARTAFKTHLESCRFKSHEMVRISQPADMRRQISNNPMASRSGCRGACRRRASRLRSRPITTPSPPWEGVEFRHTLTAVPKPPGFALN